MFSAHRIALAAAAALAASAASAQVTLNASSWVPPAHPVTATMLVPLCSPQEPGLC